MKPFIHAALAALYIVFVVSVINMFSAFPSAQHTFLIPITMLSLLVLSAAVMGYLFFYRPIVLLIEGDRRGALIFFSKMVGTFAVLVAIYLLALGVVLWRGIGAHVPSSQATLVSDPRDGIYTIDDRSVALSAGVAQTPAAPGSASMTTTRYFGNEATGDLNGDGAPDIAFILTQDGGGSGTFYYVAVALRRGDGYVGTNAVLLGDRIAPQTTEIHDGLLVVNYAERAPGEPMTAQPSQGVSKYLRVESGQLVEVPNPNK